ncbi:serine/threonine-protein kinase [Nocardia sp. NPDC048505]|uniref:serine/threonine-protein kinase n=1 Tax=unclassified Nocardia TaxID=2637762 RepID=UPI0033CEE42D
MSGKLTPATVFAGYRIDRVLGGGGMGTVYAARHPRLPRYDALKVLADEHGADPEFRARFAREAELVARLDHPNIVAVRDRGEEQGRLWIAMQLVDGKDAAALIAAAPTGLAPASALHIIGEAAAGLDAAHRAGLLHRDVKPANILLEPRPGQPDRVYVTDFGIARAATESTALTEVGAVLATLAYAAPEQIAARALDHRVDVYALGCTLYELLTGAKPFPRASAVAVMHAHLHDPPPRASARDPRLPAAIDTVLATALAKDPERRYRSCGELAEAARDAFGAPVAAAPARRTRPLIAAAALIVGVLAAAGFVALRAPDPIPGTPVALPSSAPVSAPVKPAAVSWGSYAFIADALPTLLPAAPIGSGYQGIRCVPVNVDMKQIDLNARPDKSARLSCTGNQDPLRWLLVTCNWNLVPTTLPVDPAVLAEAMTIAGDQQEDGPAGRARVIWGDTVDAAGRPEGLMYVQFDDVARNFCGLSAHGGATGQELFDRWWRDAPL